MVSYYLDGAGLDSFERSLVDKAVTLALESLEHCARREQVAVQRLGSDCISIGGVKIIVRSGADPLNFTTLVINIEQLASPSAQRRRSTCKVVGNGLFSKVKICAPTDCVDTEEIAETVRLHLEAAYRARTQDALKEMAGLERKTAAPAYEAIRRRLPQRAAEEIWLYQVEGSEGRYLLDSEARLNLMSRLAARVRSSRARSVLALYYSFAGRTLPLHNSYSDIALRDRLSMTCDLTSAPYAEGCFELAEQAVMDGNFMFGQPLVMDGHVRLMAGYPPTIRDQVESGLAQLAPELTAICSTGFLSRILRSPEISNRLASANEILELKPNAFGLGINLNALITRYSRRR